MQLQFERDVTRRIEFLQKVITQAKKELKHVPEGSLRGFSHRKSWQYFHRISAQDKRGTYIRKKDINLAFRLGQKEYDLKVIRSAEKELKLLLPLQAMQQGTAIETVDHIYEKLPRWHQAVVTPLEGYSDTFIKSWIAIKYKGKSFSPDDSSEYYTFKKERVRSKSESIIANTLYRYGIPYHYELPLELKGYGVIYPDFATLSIRRGKVIYWEHLGLIDDENYSRTAFLKIADFERNGIFLGDSLIITYETKAHPLSTKLIEQRIHQYYL